MRYLSFTYLRCGVGSEKKKTCVPEAPSAEQASEWYSNEARCVGTRCCVDPEVVLCVKIDCFSMRDWSDRIKSKIRSV